MAMPVHVGIIPDGNRRWARKNNTSYAKAYETGYARLRDAIDYLMRKGVKYVSVYTMSRDNCRKRSKLELQVLYKLLIKGMRELRERDRKPRILVMGDLTLLPVEARREIRETVEATRNIGDYTLVTAICYSGVWEVEYYMKRGLMPPSLSLPPIDLLIRTGGFRRISSFLLLLLEYAELYFTDTLWPDFTEERLQEALDWFSSQERKFGR